VVTKGKPILLTAI